MSRYLITGCAGFIASHVCSQLLAAGHRIIGLDSLNDAYDVRLKRWRLQQLQQAAGFDYRPADISDRHQLDQVLADLGAPDAEPIEAVINLAARAGVRASMLDPWAYYQCNVVGMINLFELCKRHKIGKFVQASSSSVYGDSSAVPYREDQAVNRPVSPYAASKQASETLSYSYHHLHGIDVSALRFFTVYGPAGRPDMSVFRFVRSIAEGETLTLWGDGEQRRDFTYVGDIARGVIASLRPVGYEVFNLGGDRPYSINELLSKIEQLLGQKAVMERRPAHPADVLQTWADISKAQKLLEWQPQVDLDQGLTACVNWYRQHRDFAVQLALGD